LEFPAGSEILMTALTIPEMVNIAKHHGLVPIPLDIESGTMGPEISTIELAITERTRAIVVAHLFGTRVPMGPVIELAKKRGLVMIEDCAQAFTGPDYTGHPETNVAMFSFGSIKTMTALGGALLRVKDADLLRKMRTIQRTLPMQTRKEFAGVVLTHAILKLFTLPLMFGLFYRGCQILGADFESVIAKMRGLDGTAVGSALAVIEPPVGNENREPVKTREIYRQLLYLPVDPKVPLRERQRLSNAIGEILEESSHLRLTDARRVYSAVVRTIEVPRSVADIRSALQRARRDGVPICMMGT